MYMNIYVYEFLYVYDCFIRIYAHVYEIKFSTSCNALQIHQKVLQTFYAFFIYEYIYIYPCIYLYMCVYICIHTHTRKSSQTYTHTLTHNYMCICIYMLISIHRVCSCMLKKRKIRSLKKTRRNIRSRSKLTVRKKRRRKKR